MLEIEFTYFIFYFSLITWFFYVSIKQLWEYENNIGNIEPIYINDSLKKSIEMIKMDDEFNETTYDIVSDFEIDTRDYDRKILVFVDGDETSTLLLLLLSEIFHRNLIIIISIDDNEYVKQLCRELHFIYHNKRDDFQKNYLVQNLTMIKLNLF